MKGKERLFPKLGMRYYGPFQVCDKINDVAYRLTLPKGWKIHNAFHVSILRPSVGDVPEDMVPEEQPEVEELYEILVPEQILATRIGKSEAKLQGVIWEPYTSYIREAIRERYALLPYFYTLFREANMTGTPVMRPLWMEFPEEEMTFGMDKECMVGNSLLIHGVYTEGATSESVYLPSEGPWYELKTGTAFSGGDYVKIPVTMNAIPVFQRGGTIIPRRERPRRSSSQTLNDPYTLVVALDDMLEAEGELYIDDGKSFDFAAGAYIHRKFTFSKGRLTSSNIKAKNDGKEFTSSCLIERIVLLGVRAKDLSGVKHAVVQPYNRRVELEVGPLVLRKGPQSNAYIIRKPNVLVSEDWSIKVL
ncbi:hypothetical protein L7F22_033961 [Adiantum nelumboides]|nr:hypothetical protein [Adiantum nelumboides]